MAADQHSTQSSGGPFRPDAERADFYLNGDCPVCGRRRLMPWFVHHPGEHREEERLVGIECEKCCNAWRLTEENSEPASPYGAWPHPITGEESP